MLVGSAGGVSEADRGEWRRASTAVVEDAAMRLTPELAAELDLHAAPRST